MNVLRQYFAKGFMNWNYHWWKLLRHSFHYLESIFHWYHRPLFTHLESSSQLQRNCEWILGEKRLRMGRILLFEALGLRFWNWISWKNTLKYGKNGFVPSVENMGIHPYAWYFFQFFIYGHWNQKKMDVEEKKRLFCVNKFWSKLTFFINEIPKEN